MRRGGKFRSEKEITIEKEKLSPLWDAAFLDLICAASSSPIFSLSLSKKQNKRKIKN
jgi:hypothetical protein